MWRRPVTTLRHDGRWGNLAVIVAIVVATAATECSDCTASYSVTFMDGEGQSIVACRVLARVGTEYGAFFTDLGHCTASPCLLTVDADDVELTSRLRLAVVTPDGKPRVAVGNLQNAPDACGSSTATNPLVLLGLGDDGFEAAFAEVFE